ncbi:MAG: DUF167 family protein [Devosia sp.]
MSGAIRLTPDGLVVTVRVTPNSGLDRIEGLETRDDGTSVLKLRVRAVPEDGKANKAVIALVAKGLGVPKSALALVAGETARLKTLEISGDGQALAARLKLLTG